ncbi:MAG: hypothetical protein HZA28_04620 [Candidatus Omnitrophica bacterium]|nr:hypothetical protein [Candidatus Omnitrophota bacterium]
MTASGISGRSAFWVRVRSVSCILSIFLFLGCGKTDQKPAAHATSVVSSQNAAVAELQRPGVPSPEADPFQPFHIYSDKASSRNHYVPSGFMPNGRCLSLNEAWTANCHSGKTCIRVEYDLACSRKDQKWAGIYWLSPANNWGQRKGGFNLTGAQRLTFWARGDKGGEQVQEFTVGGISGNYPDSDLAVLGPVILSGEWRQYTVDLRGKDLSYISGGFAWSTSEEVNGESCTFYLDDIRFE